MNSEQLALEADWADSGEVVCADCLEHMRTMPDCSVDAIVTDPPYGLSFMGAEWDSYGGSTGRQTVAFQESMTPIFAEALRVAKPGAHLLCFGGTRTFHRMTCAIEDAGWEIRDCIMWVYGSGFPKSMDVAKAIDKASGYVGEVVGTRVVDIGMQGGHMHAGRKQQQQQQQQVRSLSDQAARWQGWGTCLKPAWEPIIVARKPLDGTVANTVLKWGTGAINIDGCRVPTNDKLGGGLKAGGAEGVWDRPFMHDEQSQAAFVERKKANVKKSETLGRFPANLVHDGSDEVLTLFPETGRSSGGNRHTRGNAGEEQTGVYGRYIRHRHDGEHSVYEAFAEGGEAVTIGFDDSGSAARFFYCAKASKRERGEGNRHPTVKPIALMEWLVRLVTRERQVVLDPFAGSGTTLVACKSLGRRFVGIEREPEYVEIVKRRLGQL